MQWLPIETAPRDREILVADGGRFFAAFWFQFAPGRWSWAASQDCGLVKPDHWLPIPATVLSHGDAGAWLRPDEIPKQAGAA